MLYLSLIHIYIEAAKRVPVRLQSPLVKLGKQAARPRIPVKGAAFKMKGRMQAQPGGNHYHAFMAGGLEHVRAHLGHAQPHGDRRVHTRARGQRHQHALSLIHI